MQRSHGFSLIEVLVSIVVLSVALLGTAGLIGSSLKNTNTAYFRSQATVLADDYIDRMRANVAQARAGEYNADPGPTCAATTAMARYDCTQWTTTLAQALPGGSGTVSVDANGIATVTIDWDAGANSFTTKSRL